MTPINFQKVEHAIETTLHVIQRGAAALEVFDGETAVSSMALAHPSATPAEKAAFKVAAYVLRAIKESGVTEGDAGVKIALDGGLINELRALLPEIESTAALVGVKL